MSGEHGGHEYEPIPGLPGHLPEGESIVWQGTPDWKRLAVTAFHVRGVLIYFGLIGAWALAAGGGFGGLAATALAAGAAVGILCLLAWLTARATIYTITNRRVVLRIGAALPTCINVPMTIIETAGLKRYPDGSGDIPLALTGKEVVGYALLWPHVRPWKFSQPEPMLRGVPEVDHVAALLARTLADAVPEGRRIPIESSDPLPARARSGDVTGGAAAA